MTELVTYAESFVVAVVISCGGRLRHSAQRSPTRRESSAHGKVRLGGRASLLRDTTPKPAYRTWQRAGVRPARQQDLDRPTHGYRYHGSPPETRVRARSAALFRDRHQPRGGGHISVLGREKSLPNSKDADVFANTLNHQSAAPSGSRPCRAGHGGEPDRIRGSQLPRLPRSRRHPQVPRGRRDARR
jgi:hypothetical protein